MEPREPSTYLSEFGWGGRDDTHPEANVHTDGGLVQNERKLGGETFMQVLVEFFHLTATKHFPSNTQTSQAESKLHHPGE